MSLSDRVFDGDGNFLGHEPRECGEHRTVGPHRAWCFDCHEWCYPGNPCVRCEERWVYVQEGWWHPNVKAGQVHDHPALPGRSWSMASHRLCQPVYTRRPPSAG